MAMSDAEKTQTVIISTLFGAFGQAGDKNRIKIYLKALGDVPAVLLEKACKKLMLESKFLPSIAEIVEVSRELIGEAEESRRVKPWGEAWAEIERAMYSTPWGKRPTFSTPEIAQAAFGYGWDALQTSLAADMPTVRAQVRRMYDDACKGNKARANSRYVLNRQQADLLMPSRDGRLTAIAVCLPPR